jgi:uncharacterized OsmC-like protein
MENGAGIKFALAEEKYCQVWVMIKGNTEVETTWLIEK